MTERPADAASLGARISQLSIHDAHGLGRRLSQVRRLAEPARRRELGRLAERVERAERRLVLRRESVPAIAIPRTLPVFDHADELARVIAENQVVVVAGETGSGKSTQLPKICLQLGRGVKGLIGHTQPRRIAARTLAERIAEETETIVGGAIGYAIRFGDVTSPRTLVKLMTDGILLAEITGDPDLLRYDTIIIDEAHERSLNIDFLLGYLARLLPRRPDLKVIITSATIDPHRFAAHFGDAPVVEVSGRTYPVEIRYRPYGLDALGADGSDDGVEFNGDDEDDDGPADVEYDANDQVAAITEAVDELLHAGDGDILVFLSGEREITDTAEALRGHLARGNVLGRSIEVLPLYGRLSMADQHRVFAPSGKRRIVLATNVAETSLTVPGIRYVIDPGTARISRYSSRTKVQRLPIEKISQASAGQRAGRCGRVAEGICIRLYSQADFEARPQYADPEIARTSLAAVILKMAALGLGDIADFPFLDPPEAKQIGDGVTVLTELGALDRSTGRGVRLTDIGRKLADLPVDPRLARILVEADRRRCLAEILVIVSALAIRDVREYPLEEREKATAIHSRFADATSDFVPFISLWNYLKRQSKKLSGNGFRKMCKAEYLHYLRIREWQDLHAQLSSAAGALKMDIDASVAGAPLAGGDAQKDVPQKGDIQKGDIQKGGSQAGGSKKGAGRAKGAPAAVSAALADKAGGPVRGSEAVIVDHEAIHTALAAGLLSHIGARVERPAKPFAGEPKRKGLKEYQGTRGTTFAIWPGSVLAKNGAPLVLAAELVETSRLWARTVAAINPEWVERVGGDLVKRQYSEPHWSARRQAAVATEKVTLLGVTLIAARTVAYGSIDPEHARELLIRHGLVDGEMTLPLPFLDANKAALDEVAESERRARRRDIVIDDDALYALYDERIPGGITTGRALEAWWRKASRDERDLLLFTPDMLLAAGAELARRDEFPDRLDAGTVILDLDYVFEPGSADDGVSATVPLAALASIDPASFPAQVPGFRRDLALALIKSLPKTVRRALVPAPDFADAALARIGDDAGALPDRLAEALTALAGTPVRTTDFDYSKVPDHLRMRFTVVDDKGRTVAAGEDLAAIKRELVADTRKAVAKASFALEATGLTRFPAEGVPRRTTGTVGGQEVIGYPALVDEGSTVGLRVYTTEEDQKRAMRRGTRKLVALSLAGPIGGLAGRMKQLAAPRGPHAPGAKPGLTPGDLLRLSIAPHGSLPALVTDAADAAIDALLDWAGGPAWDATAFGTLMARINGQLERAVTDILAATVAVLDAGIAADAAITTLAGGDPATAKELRRERDGWLRPGFISAVRAQHLPDVARYLTALATRAERAVSNPDRDQERAAEIAELQRDLGRRVEELRPERREDDDVLAAQRLIAEYRIALFAQPMRTAIPVSAKRIRAAIAALAD